MLSALIPRYPRAKVRLVGEDSNAFAILGAVSLEATAGDYDHLLVTAMRWVDTE